MLKYTWLVVLVLQTRIADTASTRELEEVILWQAEQLRSVNEELKRVQEKLSQQRSSDSTQCLPHDTPSVKRKSHYIEAFRPNATRVVSRENPRLYLLEGFFTDEECDHILKVGEPYLKESLVVGAKDGAGLRKSRSAFLPRSLESQDPIIQGVVQKIHDYVKLPIEYGEDLQVASYEPGNKYEFHKDSDAQVGRFGTFLAYLMDTEEGGETIFPAVIPKSKRNRKGKRRSELPKLNFHKKEQPGMQEYCDSDDFFRVKPRKGDAVLFFNHHPDLRADPYSLHGACPVKKGRKAVVQRWLRFWKASEGNVFYDTFIRGTKFETMG